jgi:hypothetical protein
MDYNNISFTVDLVEAAMFQVQFLKEIDNYGIFYEGELLDKAIYRYFKFFFKAVDAI